MGDNVIETYSTEQMADMIKSFLQRNSVSNWDEYDIVFEVGENNKIMAHKILANKGEK